MRRLDTAAEFVVGSSRCGPREVEEPILPETITVEAHTPGDSATMFRLWIDDRIIGESLTAVQAHLRVGEILERVALPGDGLASRRPAPQIQTWPGLGP